MAAAPQLVVKELVEAAEAVANCDKLSTPLQRQNATVLVRRVRLMLPVLEEVRETKMLLPPSAVAAFQELHSIMLRASELLEKCRDSSRLRLVEECQEFSYTFFQIARDMAVALTSLPLNLLELSTELKEQVELLKLQSSRSSPFVDPDDSRLREELVTMLQEFERKKTPSSDRIDALFKSLLLNNSKDCKRELQQLQAEQASSIGRRRHGKSTTITIRNLINFLCYSSCVLYGMIAEMEDERTQQEQHTESSSNSDESEKESNIPAMTTSNFTIPDEFKCPISLELMRDPVIIATGQTYDRASIQQWLEAGNLTCPKSGQKLIHMTLIPNYALRSLVAQWCEKNRVPFQMPDKDVITHSDGRAKFGADHIANSQATIEAAKMTASFLVGKIATGSAEIQKQAAYELRLLAKSGMENRKCIAEAGAIPFLVSLLSSKDPETQQNSITALLNLSILDNNKSLIMSAGALDPILDVLCNARRIEARENAAATIFSLSALDEIKKAIGNKKPVIPALVDLLKNGTLTGRKDAVSALFNLSLFQANKSKVVEAGAVEILSQILSQTYSTTNTTNPDLVENSLALLGLLASSEEGSDAISKTCVMASLVKIMERGAQREKENSAAVILALCRNANHQLKCNLMAVPGSISALNALLATGSPRAKRKVASLFKTLHKWDPDQSSFLPANMVPEHGLRI